MSEHDNGYDPYNSATTRKAPPIPAWLRNDPELEALAIRMVMDQWRACNPWVQVGGKYREGSHFEHAAMYHK